jgi:hypothetical protein
LRRNKRKDKKKKSSSAGKELDGDGNESIKDIGSDGEDVHKSETPTPEVDDEGYSKQPPQPPGISSSHDPWADFNRTKTFDSSSDDSGELFHKLFSAEIAVVEEMFFFYIIRR